MQVNRVKILNHLPYFTNKETAFLSLHYVNEIHGQENVNLLLGTKINDN